MTRERKARTEADEPRLPEVDRRRFMQSTGAAVGALAVGSGLASAGSYSYSETDVTVESFDGVTLAATLFEPDGDESHPAIVMTHGWGSKRDSPFTDLRDRARFYASNGYVVLIYDSRGFGESEGEVGLNGPNEVGDVSALIDWLADHGGVELEGPGNPVVGMDGISYAGGIQLNAATTGEDRLNCLVPRITWNDLTYSLAPNDVIKIGWMTLLIATGTLSAWDLDPEHGIDSRLFSWYLYAAWHNELSGDAGTALRQRSGGAYETTSFNGDRFVVEGGGWDIEEDYDEFHYVSETMRGDGELVARVASQEHTHDWAKAGVMIRDSLDPASRHAMTVVTPDNGTAFQYREADGADLDGTDVGGETPQWVKIERVNDVFHSYTSADGESWEEIGSVSIEMDEPHVGLAVTSHEEGTLCEATFDYVEGLSHDPAGFWENRDVGDVDVEGSASAEHQYDARELGELDTPALLIQGWDDALFPTLEAVRTYRDLEERDVDTSLVFYEGGHAISELFQSESDAEYVNGIALDWMDRHLKGKDRDVPEVAMYLKQPGVWRTHDAFPIEDVPMQTLSLRDAASGDYTYLKKDVWWWNDTSHRFTWRAGEDLEIVGTPSFSVWVYCSGPEERLFFRFYHTDEDGYTTMINNVGETYRVEGEGYHRIEFEFPTFQRFLREDELLEVEIGVSDPFYFDSRDSDGVYVMHSEEYPSTFDLPYEYTNETYDVDVDVDVGDEVHAAVEGLTVRDGPGEGADEIDERHVYSSGHIVDGPVSADGHTWWQITWWEDDEGLTGWSVEDGLGRGAMNSERLATGDRVAVDTPWFTDLNVREGPGLEYDVVDQAEQNDEGRIVDGPEWNEDDDENFVWWQVEYDDNETGWSGQDYLERA